MTNSVKELPVMAITGTSKGIGLGIAKYFSSNGYRVAGCSRSPAAFLDQNYIHSITDIENEAQTRDWFRYIKKMWGRVDVLVSNAGFASAAQLFLKTQTDTLEKTVNTNIIGNFNVCREAAKMMILQKYGRIITVSSMAVGLHEEGTSIYSASKSAVVEMTKIMAKELAPFNITCNTMAPSMYMTDAVDDLGDQVIKHALERLTIKRVLSIEEICNVISFYASEVNSSITGQILYMGLVD